MDKTHKTISKICSWRLLDGSRYRAQIICQDRGPGIEDIDAVIENGDPEVHEEGMGLPGARRLMDEFEIQSEPGVGTKVIACKWLPGHQT